MPAGPSNATTLQRPDLGIAFEEFSLDAHEAGMIAPLVAPPFQAARSAGNFTVLPIEEALRDIDTDRAHGGKYAEDTVNWESTTYSTSEQGTVAYLDDREREIYSHYLEIEAVVARRARSKILRKLEIDAAAQFFSTSVITSTADVTHEWDDESNATPVGDVDSAKDTFRGNCGRYPNALIMNAKVRKNLAIVDEIQELIKYSGVDDPKPENIADRALAAALGVPRLIVAGDATMKLSSDEGQTPTLADIWSDEYALLATVAMTSDLQESCLGRIFHWAGDGSSLAVTTEQYRVEDRRSDAFRARMDYQVKVIYANCGHLIGNVTTI